MANTTLNWQLRGILKHLSKGGRLIVLTSYVLHANTRNRAWIGVDGIAQETGLSRPTVIAAKKWLEEHGAITPVPSDKWVSEELNLHHLVDVFEITGTLTIDGKQYPYLYANPESLEVESLDQKSLGKKSLRKDFCTEGSIKDSKDSQDITPAPNGAALDSDSSPKQRTALEIAVITEIFNLPADTPFDARQARKRKGAGYLVGQIHNWIKREYPTHTAVEVERFKVYYANAPESRGAAMVTDLAKFEAHYRRFAVALARKQQAAAARETTPPPPPPVLLTETERLAALERLEQARREREQRK